jgi:hypothetical protein
MSPPPSSTKSAQIKTIFVRVLEFFFFLDFFWITVSLVYVVFPSLSNLLLLLETDNCWVRFGEGKNWLYNFFADDRVHCSPGSHRLIMAILWMFLILSCGLQISIWSFGRATISFYFIYWIHTGQWGHLDPSPGNAKQCEKACKEDDE